MQGLVELLKIIAGLAVIVGVGYYWLTHGLPPRGRGRWRQVLSKRKEQRRKS